MASRFPSLWIRTVALLAEGVDRNAMALPREAGRGVALLAEGVDRNSFSPSSWASMAGRPPRGGRG